MTSATLILRRPRLSVEHCVQEHFENTASHVYDYPVYSTAQYIRDTKRDIRAARARWSKFLHVGLETLQAKQQDKRMNREFFSSYAHNIMMASLHMDQRFNDIDTFLGSRDLSESCVHAITQAPHDFYSSVQRKGSKRSTIAQRVKHAHRWKKHFNRYRPLQKLDKHRLRLGNYAHRQWKRHLLFVRAHYATL
jgi:hypothetical protein